MLNILNYLHMSNFSLHRLVSSPLSSLLCELLVADLSRVNHGFPTATRVHTVDDVIRGPVVILLSFFFFYVEKN